MAPIGTNEFDVILDLVKVCDTVPNYEDPDLNNIEDVEEDESDKVKNLINEGGQTP